MEDPVQSFKKYQLYIDQRIVVCLHYFLVHYSILKRPLLFYRVKPLGLYLLPSKEMGQIKHQSISLKDAFTLNVEVHL